MYNVKTIQLDRIKPSPYQHRKHFDGAKLEELSDSMQRDGLLQPITVRELLDGSYELIAGERRLRAAKLYTTTIEARIIEVTDIQARRLCAAENMQRDDLSAVETVGAIVEMVDAELIEDEEYAAMGEGGVTRVKWLLGRMNADYTNKTEYVIHKFVYKVESIFSSLPKPVDWRTFYNHDLPLVTKLDDVVRQIAIERRLNKSQAKALDKLKKKNKPAFERLISKADNTKEVVDPFTPDDDGDEPIPLEELSAKEIRQSGCDTVSRESEHETIPHVLHNSGQNEWYTPREYTQAAKRVMGSIDLDPASSEVANKLVQADTFYTAAQNGLSLHWFGNVWMNPPYSSDLIGRFCDKLVTHFQNEDVAQAVVLVNNATETEWFFRLVSVASVVCFTKSRVKFIGPSLIATGAPLQGQAIIGIGCDVELFKKEFRSLGWVATL